MDYLDGTRTRRKFRSVDTGVHDRSNSQLSLERDLGFDLNPDLNPDLDAGFLLHHNYFCCGSLNSHVRYASLW